MSAPQASLLKILQLSPMSLSLRTNSPQGWPYKVSLLSLPSMPQPHQPPRCCPSVLPQAPGFSVCGSLFPQIPTGLTPSPSSGLCSNVLFFWGLHWDSSVENWTLAPLQHCSFFFLIVFLYSTYHRLIYYLLYLWDLFVGCFPYCNLSFMQ